LVRLSVCKHDYKSKIDLNELLEKCNVAAEVTSN